MWCIQLVPVSCDFLFYFSTFHLVISTTLTCRRVKCEQWKKVQKSFHAVSLTVDAALQACCANLAVSPSAGLLQVFSYASASFLLLMIETRQNTLRPFLPWQLRWFSTTNKLWVSLQRSGRPIIGNIISVRLPIQLGYRCLQPLVPPCILQATCPSVHQAKSSTEWLRRCFVIEKMQRACSEVQVVLFPCNLWIGSEQNVFRRYIKWNIVWLLVLNIM